MSVVTPRRSTVVQAPSKGPKLPRRDPTSRWGPPAALLALLLLTAAAGLLRTAGLSPVEGTMGRDAGRLGLAARGILEHGLPVLPSGFVYTRGLLPAYLEAASFALFGVSDLSARLISLIHGTLLVPAVYLLGRSVHGRLVGLAAAAIVAFSAPLVPLAHHAWLYSPFLFWLVLALVWLQQGGLRPRVLAGLATAAALLSHEFAILLLPTVALYDLLRFGPTLRRRPTDPQFWRQLAAYWLPALAAAVLVVGLSLKLRTPTAGGTTAEMREYLQPGLDLPGLLAGLRTLGDWFPWLPPAALLGLLFWGERSGRAALLYLMLGVLLLFNLLLLGNRGSVRFLYMTVPILAVAGPYGLARASRTVLRLLGVRLGMRRVVIAGLLALLALSTVDQAGLAEDRRAGQLRETWLSAVADRRPDDLILTYAPTVTSYYLGRTDFWLRPRGYEKYVWAGSFPSREIHANAILVRDARELEELVIRPNAGRTLWAILDDDTPDSASGARQAYAVLTQRASSEHRTQDGHRVLRVQL